MQKVTLFTLYSHLGFRGVSRNEKSQSNDLTLAYFLEKKNHMTSGTSLGRRKRGGVDMLIVPTYFFSLSTL